MLSALVMATAVSATPPMTVHNAVILTSPTAMECPGDFNGDGSTNIMDILDYINAFVTGDDSTDYNGDGSIDIQDAFAFLQDWVTGFFDPDCGG